MTEQRQGGIMLQSLLRITKDKKMWRSWSPTTWIYKEVKDFGFWRIILYPVLQQHSYLLNTPHRINVRNKIRITKVNADPNLLMMLSICECLVSSSAVCLRKTFDDINRFLPALLNYKRETKRDSFESCKRCKFGFMLCAQILRILGRIW